MRLCVDELMYVDTCVPFRGIYLGYTSKILTENGIFVILRSSNDTVLIERCSAVFQTKFKNHFQKFILFLNDD